MSIEPVVIGVIRYQDKILIAQRRKGDSYPLHWEFPGGQQERGESDVACLKREIREELGITVYPIQALPPILYPAPKGWRLLKPYECLFLGGEPRAIECRAFRWIFSWEVSRFKFPPADRPVIEWLLRQKRSTRLSLAG
jgi:8-oxo-dGTP diphosphatase